MIAIALPSLPTLVGLPSRCIGRRSLLRVVRVLGATMACMAVSAWAASPKTLVIGVISPSKSVEETREIWQPIAEKVRVATGRPTIVEATKDYSNVIQGMREGRIQLGFAGNVAALQLLETGHADVFAQHARADGSTSYRSVLIARKDGPLTSIHDVYTKARALTLFLGDPKSTSGYVVPTYYLFDRRQVKPEQLFRTVWQGSSHIENAQAVASGRADVASSNDHELDKFSRSHPSEHARVKVLWTSPPIPESLLLIQKNLEPKLRERIENTVLTYGTTDDEKAVLKRLNNIAAFAAAHRRQLVPIADLETFAQIKQVRSDAALSAKDRERRISAVYARAKRLEQLLQ
jgi:phosphonate transport system substrate-binding protein